MADPQPTAYRFDEFRLDVARGTLQGPGNAPLDVRPKAFALLRFLVENPGRLHGRSELLDTLWPGVIVTDDSLTQCVSDLRRAFGERAPYVLRTLPRRGYVLTAEVRAETAEHAPPTAPSAASAARAALLIIEPYEHIGAAAAALARALTSDLLTELSRFEGVRVFAAPHGETGGAYRIRGDLRLSGRTLRIATRLDDAATGATLWADRTDEARDRSGDVPDGVVERLAAALVRQADREDLRHARQKPQSALTARELCLIGQEHHQRGTEADTFIALAMFYRAIAADPDDAPGYAWQAFTVQRVVTYGWGPPNGAQGALDRALALARRAVQLAPDSPLCLSRLAFALMLHQRWDEAIMTARAAMRTARPTDYATANACAEVLAHGGCATEAAEMLQRGLALDPHCPPVTRSLLGRALLLAGKPEEALAELYWCAAHLPDYVPCFHSLIVAAVETGRPEEAQAALRESLRLQPHWVPRNHTGTWFFRYASDAERFLAAFRAAGWHAAAPDPADEPRAEQARPDRLGRAGFADPASSPDDPQMARPVGTR